MTKTIPQSHNEYRTSDFALAVVLSLSYPIEAVDKENPRRAYFVFRGDSELNAKVEAFYRDDLRVSPAAFFNQMRLLKARLYD